MKFTESMSNLVEDFVKFLRQRCLEMANQVKHKKKKLKKMTFRTVNTLYFMQQRLLDQIEKLSFFKIKSLTKTSVTTFLSPTRIPHSQIRIFTAYF